MELNDGIMKILTTIMIRRKPSAFVWYTVQPEDGEANDEFHFSLLYVLDI